MPSLTLPAAIWGATQSPGGDARALVLCLVATVLALGAVLAAEVVSARAARWREPR